MLSRLFTFAVFLSVVFIGCTNENPQGRLPLEGTVLLNDKPIASGSISFEPVGDQQEKTTGGAVIQDGKYSVMAKRGLIAGDYIVRIHAPTPGKEIDKNTGMPVTIDLVPPKYNVASQEKFTVSSNKKTYDFNLVVEEKDFQGGKTIF